MSTYYIMCRMPLSMPLPLFVEQGEPRHYLQPFICLCSPLTPRGCCKSCAREVPEATPYLPLIGSGADESRTCVLPVVNISVDSAVVVPLFRGNNCRIQLPLCGTLGTSQHPYPGKINLSPSYNSKTICLEPLGTTCPRACLIPCCNSLSDVVVLCDRMLGSNIS